MFMDNSREIEVLMNRVQSLLPLMPTEDGLEKAKKCLWYCDYVNIAEYFCQLRAQLERVENFANEIYRRSVIIGDKMYEETKKRANLKLIDGDTITKIVPLMYYTADSSEKCDCTKEFCLQFADKDGFVFNNIDVYYKGNSCGKFLSSISISHDDEDKIWEICDILRNEKIGRTLFVKDGSVVADGCCNFVLPNDDNSVKEVTKIRVMSYKPYKLIDSEDGYYRLIKDGVELDNYKINDTEDRHRAISKFYMHTYDCNSRPYYLDTDVKEQVVKIMKYNDEGEDEVVESRPYRNGFVVEDGMSYSPWSIVISGAIWVMKNYEEKETNAESSEKPSVDDEHKIETGSDEENKETWYRKLYNGLKNRVDDFVRGIIFRS